VNYFYFPLEEWTNAFADWFIPTVQGFFEAVSGFFGFLLDGLTGFLLWVRPEVIAIVIVLIAWRAAGKWIALLSLIGLLYLGSVNLWAEAMQTLAIVLAATFFAIVIGIPLGILSAKKKAVDRVVRPILDFMQTLPSFVYLIPTVLLIGIGGVSAMLSTFIFAAPPVVRLTNLGIRQVPADVVEAARAFGSTSWQMLAKVQLPMAMPTIMAGVNQTIMLALSMAVIAAMIGAPGLGSIVLAGITQVDVGKGFVGGLGIVVLAIILDRVTEGLGRKKENKK
jgi:glycine betaine/proline transport system permease protein